MNDITKEVIVGEQLSAVTTQQIIGEPVAADVSKSGDINIHMEESVSEGEDSPERELLALDISILEEQEQLLTNYEQGQKDLQAKREEADLYVKEHFNLQGEGFPVAEYLAGKVDVKALLESIVRGKEALLQMIADSEKILGEFKNSEAALDVVAERLPQYRADLEYFTSADHQMQALTTADLEGADTQELLVKINDMHSQNPSFGWNESENNNREQRTRLLSAVTEAKVQQELPLTPILRELFACGMTEAQLYKHTENELLEIIQWTDSSQTEKDRREIIRQAKTDLQARFTVLKKVIKSLLKSKKEKTSSGKGQQKAQERPKEQAASK